MVDYRKFDHIDTDSDEEISAPKELQPTIPSDQKPQPMTKKGKEGRFKFEHNGITIYEWEQSMNEVNIYIEPPPGISRKQLDIVIGHNRLRVGIKGTNPFIDENTGGAVKPDESLWTLLDGEININLQKMNKAEAWECALVGQAGQSIDAFTKEEVKKKLLLERFQEEVWCFIFTVTLFTIVSLTATTSQHPGFDFSSADFNGQVPDAREFMGGVKHF